MQRREKQKVKASLGNDPQRRERRQNIQLAIQEWPASDAPLGKERLLKALRSPLKMPAALGNRFGAG